MIARPSTVAEARRALAIARRLTAHVLMHPELGSNYEGSRRPLTYVRLIAVPGGLVAASPLPRHDPA